MHKPDLYVLSCASLFWEKVECSRRSFSPHLFLYMPFIRRRRKHKNKWRQKNSTSIMLESLIFIEFENGKGALHDV